MKVLIKIWFLLASFSFLKAEKIVLYEVSRFLHESVPRHEIFVVNGKLTKLVAKNSFEITFFFFFLKKQNWT